MMTRWGAALFLLAACARSAAMPNASRNAPPRSTESAVQHTAWRRVVPVRPTTPSFRPPSVDTKRLQNGLTIHTLKEGASVPLVAVRVVVRAGAQTDPANASGLAEFTAAMLERGTAKKPSKEFADALDTLGVSLSVHTGIDSSSVTLIVPEENLDAGVALLSETVQSPDFSQEEFVKQRDEFLSRVRTTASDARGMTRSVLRGLLYGVKRADGRLSYGNTKSITAISRDDVLAHYRGYWRPEHAAIVIAGASDPLRARSTIEKWFWGWSGIGNGRPLPRSLITRIKPQPGVYIIAHNSTQSSIAAGYGTPVTNSAAANVLIRALGGSHSSRLSATLRDDKGYTYFVRSKLIRSRYAGHLVVYGHFALDHTAEAIKYVQREMLAIAESGFLTEELQAARNGALFSFQWGFRSASETVARFNELFDEGGDTREWVTYAHDLSNVTPDLVQNLARTYLRADDLVVVVRGPRDELVSQFEAAGIGPIFIVEGDRFLQSGEVVVGPAATVR
jgi:zinc protease